MKKLFLSLIVSIAFFSCSKSPEKKAESLIKDNMKEILKDPSSYEAISFSKLDTLWLDYYETAEAKRLNRIANEAKATAELMSSYCSLAYSEGKLKEGDVYRDSMRIYSNIAIEALANHVKNLENYKGEFVGWFITHKYRAKNGFGALDVFEKNFYFDKELTKIVEPYGIRKKN